VRPAANALPSHDAYKRYKDKAAYNVMTLYRYIPIQRSPHVGATGDHASLEYPEISKTETVTVTKLILQCRHVVTFANANAIVTVINFYCNLLLVL